MSIKDKILGGADANLHLSFDVGHSSIGWAVLEKTGAKTGDINILGCGSVVFRADDCLASSRRAYRRQRRHIRSTRQRIARMKILLNHLGVLTGTELDRPGCAWPWKLAAQILQGGNLLTWPELWDVLRWYAHNRGYDGNQRWSNHEVIQAFSTDGLRHKGKPSSEDESNLVAAAERADAESGIQNEADSDVKKVKEAFKQMGDYGKVTMAETMTSHVAKFEKETAEYHQGKRTEKPVRFKGLGAAFPRRIIRDMNGQKELVGGVEWEVRFILRAHFGKLHGCDEKFEQAICGGLPEKSDDWMAISCFKIRLHKCYQGGLLFGQLVPRFDNRIISQCPFTFAENYQNNLDEGLTPKEAKHKAEIAAKVPGKNCLEFLEFRWAMTLSNIGVGFGNETYEIGKRLRPLTIGERLKVDARVRQLGFLKIEKDEVSKKTGLMKVGKNELREIVLEETKCDRHNLDSLLLHPDAKDGLKLIPVAGNVTAFRLAFSCFDAPKHDKEGGFYRDDSIRRRFIVQLLRQKSLTLNEILRQLEKIGKSEIAERVRKAAQNETSKSGKVDEARFQDLLEAKFHCEKLSGRARFSREKMKQAVQQAFHKDNPIHPLEKDGCLEQTDAIKQAAIQKDLAEQTNNHLVRHRLRILVGDPKAKRKRKPGEPKPGLLEDIIAEFANGDKRRIARITIELARDLQEMSGMDSKKKAKELTIKLGHHKQVSEELATKLRDANGNPLRDADGKPFFSKPGLIRKAMILDDLENRCPYTGQDIEFVHLVYPHLKFGRADKDHVIPRSQRLSDALEAQVITFSEINLLKSNRTAIQFIRDMNQPENRLHKDRFGIKTEAQFRRDVEALWPKFDPFKRTRAGGAKTTDDEARCWRRKQFLLKETWDEKEFTPGDLTKTRHIVKLAAQQLETAFLDLAPEQRPPVIPLIGAVTATFRDKSWKLLGELAAVNPAVKEVLDNGAKDWDAGKNFNPKKAVREVTHLHHALDALTLGLITDLLVPPGHRSLDGELARLIVKGKLTVDKEKNLDELATFRTLCAKLRLPRFVSIDNRNRLYIESLSEPIKKQIRQRLAEKRVVQHIPADMSGLICDETVYHVFDPNDITLNSKRLKRWFEKLLLAGELKKLTVLPDPKNEKDSLVLLTARKRRNQQGGDSGKTLHDTGNEWRWIYLLTGKDAVHGLNPTGTLPGKLSAIKAVKVLGDNFGVAAITEKGVEPKFEMLRPRKVFEQLEKLRQIDPNARLQIIRKGTLFRLTENDNSQTLLRIFGCGERPGRGIYFDAGNPDAKDREREIPISAFTKGNANIIETTLTGIAVCPTTSSA
jgi:CRISPR-associated endonuclease Csn1